MGVDIEMIARIPRAVTESEVKRVAVRMQIAFGRDTILWVTKPGRGEGAHCLSLLEPDHYAIAEAEIQQDGCSYVRLNTLGRYYGPGYTRGSLVEILAVARFIRTAFDGAEVFYGGDHGGPLPPLDDERERELWALFTSGESRSYFDHSRGDETTTVCGFCEVRTNTYSWSANECITACPSCGQRWRFSKTTKAHTIVPELDK